MCSKLCIFSVRYKTFLLSSVLAGVGDYLVSQAKHALFMTHVTIVYVLQECKLAMVWDQQKLLQVNRRKDFVFM